MRLLAVALLLAGVPLSSRAESPLAGCHCFRDRSYDPARPAAADAYLLATTRNSLLSAAFGISKREIVQAEMGGAAPDDLWVAHWVGARADRSPAVLLAAKAARGAWKPALGDAARRIGGELAARLERGAAPPELAAVAVDDVLVARLGADRVALQAVRAAGATNAEAVLAVVAGGRASAPPAALFAAVRAGKSWGSLLHGAGVAPEQLDGIVRAALR
jgi:hypothetical protein